ncbi:MAG TPA: sigma-70 family RNA polymerase sigma factor, partial [Vicinamibacterales bacterium]|nr:sigma-70 family RNA polymerase sigma factor [Vicinamibacterales bacterium]
MAAPPADSQLQDLVRRYARLVRSVASRIGGSRGRSLADDVEQEVFISLWKQLDREQTIDNPSSYIYRCAVRETIRLLNRHGDAPAEADVPEPEAPTLSADDRLQQQERARVVAAVIKELPIDRRRAVQAYL